MKRGFYIREVKVVGVNLKTASVKLTRGANLIVGASDTGKSYLFSVLNYVLGGSSIPREIPESLGYSEFYLEIRPFSSDESYSLKRSLGSNSIEVRFCKLSMFETSKKERHIYTTTGKLENDKNISSFLLNFCNLEKKKLLKSKRTGKTENLGIKALLALTVIPEQRIITLKSPFYFSDNVTKQVSDQSFIKLLLTGNDFANVKEVENHEIRETRINGKLEFISNQISTLAADKEDNAKFLDSENFNDDFEESVRNLESLLDVEIEKVSSLSYEKNSLIKRLNTLLNRKNYNTNLLQRFEILKKQYLSDLLRLEFISEAENYSSQLGDAICPICSSSLESNHIYHLEEVERFKEAVIAETQKIKLKDQDLVNSIGQLINENNRLVAEIEGIEVEIDSIQTKLDAELNPKIKTLKNDLRYLLRISESVNKSIYINEQITSLLSEKSRLLKMLDSKESSETPNLLEYNETRNLCQKIENRLSNWKYERNVSVDFDTSYKVFDILISGKSRKSYGKGKRAISYAACILGLLDYCLEYNMPFSNLVVLDSPLTTYEEKKRIKDSDLSDSIQSAFFMDLVNTSSNSQIIIFDNKQPPSNVRDSINTVEFTGQAELGRIGFFNE